VEDRPLGDRDLIVRAKSGDSDAFVSLIRAHQGLGLRVAYLIVRDAHEAEDVLQEAVFKSHRALGRFREEAEFRPWFLRIVRNEALNRKRSAGRRQGLVLRSASVSGDAVPSPETVFIEEERRRRLLAALEVLPRPVREVIECRYLLELNERETAAVLRIAPGTVKSRTSRGLERLRAVMDEAMG
jgi:RNA polymerase sigma-70 factor (ECF subfamily)